MGERSRFGRDAKDIGDIMGIKGLGTPEGKCLGRHGTSRAGVQVRGGRQLWSQKVELKL